MRGLAGTLVACSAALSGCAQAPMAAAPAGSAAGGQCFLASQVSGYSSVADDLVDVKVGANRYYRLQTLGSCPGTMFSQPVALRSIGGGSWICRDRDAEIIAGGDRCLVRGVTPISREAYQAASGD